MTIAIVGAMAIEIEFLIQEIGYQKKIEKNGYCFWLSEYANKQIIMTSSGVGKVAAAILATTLVNLFPNINLIINVGVAGGIQSKTKIGEVVAFTKYAYYDADATYFEGYVYGQIPGCPAYFHADQGFLTACQGFINTSGMVLTGDMFFTNQNAIDEVVKEHFPMENVISLDMESTAFAQSYYHLDFAFASLRVISDIIGGTISEYEQNLESCSHLACKTLLAILKKM